MYKVLAALCLALAGFSANAVECTLDHVRKAEVEAIDRAEIADKQSRFGAAVVPARVRIVMDRLLAVSTLKAPVELLGYGQDVLNAHAADHGAVLVASGVWSDKLALDDDELATVLGHELAHVEAQHMTAFACSCLQRLGTVSATVKDALQTIAEEAFDSSTALSREVREEAQQRELQADRRAVELLRLAGFKEDGAARLFARLQRAPGGFQSTSHPDAQDRIALAQER